MLTNTRYFPKGSIKITPKNVSNVEIGLYSTNRKINGKDLLRYGFIAYSGKRTKPDMYYIYPNLAQREEAISHYLKNIKSHEEWKQKCKDNRILKTNPVKVGDIFYTSWGYDQTNVEFYQVLEVKGQFAQIRQICCSYDETGFLSGNKTALKNKFVKNAEPMRKKVLTNDGGNSVYFSISDCQTAWQWDGRPKYSSSYA